MPDFVLDSLRLRAATGGFDRPAHPGGVAVVDEEDGGQVVCACDARAAAAGIGVGMALNSALALLPGLHVQARDVAAERALLEAVAIRALGFTPRVTLEHPDGVLLEVRGSLRLFGGVGRLRALVRGQLQVMGIEPRLALTPAPLASLWLARAGMELALQARSSLAGRLAGLPLAVTRWPEKSLRVLEAMGVRTVGECLRLPRDGFARRFEPAMLRALDCAVGRVPDPRIAFRAREKVVVRRDLEPETADAARLEAAIRPLLDELCVFLRQRGRGVTAVELRLCHREAAATRVRLRFAAVVGEAGRIAGLLHERLARVALPEPVRAVRLASGPLVELPEGSAELFAADRRVSGAAVPQLVERLRARLGADAVQGIRHVPEHRPESAWKKEDTLLFPALAEKKECPLFLLRPLWLLTEPQPLGGGERPRFEGVLEIEEGPERIESGWWDGRDVRRDYYVARNPAGVRLWVFRAHACHGAGARYGGWFLHGVFG